MERLWGSVSTEEYGRSLAPFLAQAAAYSLSILRQRSDAEDAVQQAALRGFERLDTYESSQPFKGWWFAVLKNCCHDILRERRLRRARMQDAARQPSDPPGETHGHDALTQALEKLSPEHGEILRLKYFGGMKYSEIARALDIPEGTVMSRLHLARKALATVMRPEEP